jgi:hypothetical protein
MAEVGPEMRAKQGNDRRASKVSQDLPKKPALHTLVSALQEKKKEDLGPGHGHQQHPHHAHTMVAGGHGHEKHPHHARTMLDDHLKTPMDHSVHWTQLIAAHKPHKPDFIDKVENIMLHLKSNDNDVLARLKEDPTAKMQQDALMSKVAGHIEHPNEHEEQARRKAPLRTATSLKRDAAIDKLDKVMHEHHRSHHVASDKLAMAEENLGIIHHEQAAEEEEEEEEETWEALAFDGSPARKRENKATYTVLTQKRKAARPNTPGRERKGDHPLDLISIFEVTPRTPPRAKSDEPDPMDTHCITVHASDFIKYGHDVEMLKKLDVHANDAHSLSEPTAAADPQQSTHDQEKSYMRSTAASRHAPGTGDKGLQVPQSRGQSASRFLVGSRLLSQPTGRASSARATSARARTGIARQLESTGTWPPAQPRSRPSSARTSRPVSARPRGDTWPPARPLSSEPTSCRRKARPTPFLPLKGQSH